MIRWAVRYMIAWSWENQCRRGQLGMTNGGVVSGSYEDRLGRHFFPMLHWYAKRYHPGVKVTCAGAIFDVDPQLRRLTQTTSERDKAENIRRIANDGVHNFPMCRQAWVEDGIATADEIQAALEHRG